jgi:hypothetical protein
MDTIDMKDRYDTVAAKGSDMIDRWMNKIHKYDGYDRWIDRCMYT